MPDADVVASILNEIATEREATQVVPAPIPATPAPAKPAIPVAEPIIPAKVENKVEAKVEDKIIPAQPVVGKDDWKKLSEKELFEAKGFDQKHLDVLQHIKNGTFDSYIKSYTTDFAKMSDLDLRRMQLEEENSDMTPEQRTRLFNNELKRRGLTEDSTDEEKEDAELQLKTEMRSYRKAQIAQQEASRIPEYKDNAAAQVAAEKEIQDYMDTTVKPHAAYKELHEKGTLTVGTGDAAFNLDANLDQVLALLSDQTAEAASYADKDGNPDVRKQLLMGAINLKGPDAFVETLFRHWNNSKTIGLVQNLRNEQRPGATATQSAKEPDEIDRLIDTMQGRKS